MPKLRGDRRPSRAARLGRGLLPRLRLPLFWAEAPEPIRPVAEDDDDDSDLAPAVRRRPGTGGRQLIEGEACPFCHELNQPSAVYCQRCGAEMRPMPPPPPPRVIEQVVVERVPVAVAAQDDRTSLWIWLVTILGVLVFVQLVLLLVAVVG